MPTGKGGEHGSGLSYVEGCGRCCARFFLIQGYAGQSIQIALYRVTKLPVITNSRITGSENSPFICVC